eukprot:1149224-Pelagomonas_calceolata.AAC.3
MSIKWECPLGAVPKTERETSNSSARTRAVSASGRSHVACQCGGSVSRAGRGSAARSCWRQVRKLGGTEKGMLMRLGWYRDGVEIRRSGQMGGLGKGMVLRRQVRPATGPQHLECRTLVGVPSNLQNVLAGLLT